MIRKLGPDTGLVGGWTGQDGAPSLDCMVSQNVGAPAPPPLDRAGLEAALRPFGESRMLPRAAYVDPDVFAWEQRHLGRGRGVLLRHYHRTGLPRRIGLEPVAGSVGA